DTITLNGMYQRVDRRTRAFAQVESANLINPALPASPVLIEPFDRLAVASDSTVSPQKNNYWNWSAEWRVLGQKLNYVGGLVRSQNGPPGLPTGADNGNFFDNSYPQPQLAAFGIQLDSRSKQTSHEVRLSSDDRLFGLLDYIVGYFQAQNTSRSLQGNFTPVFLGAVASPLTPVTTNLTPVDVLSKFKESSFFGNLTLHLGDKLEVAGGLRRISFRSSQGISISGVPNPSASFANDFKATIYSGSVKYRFNRNIMVYASIGTSWRPAPAVIGDFSLNQTPLERSFINLGPETSKSYEGGFRSTLLDGRLTLNATYYHQSFKNYPYRPVQAVSFVSTNFNSALGTNLEAVLTGPGGFNFVAPVPVKVDGVEAEAMFQASQRWNIGVNISYTHGRFSGLIPCNDYNPRDGKPDVTTIVPTVAQVRAATGGDNLSTCNVTQSSNQAPRWSGTLQSEYHFPVREGADAFIRGFATYYGNSANDPTNAVDDVPKYVLANAFVGLRDTDGGWEVSLFAKNFTNVKRVLTRNPGVLTTNYATLTGSKVGTTTYRTVSTNDPREIGISLRMAIGSR
ncbi:MAG TPA: TonB-dependent receptor, partial [Novosphingobium sp.]